jgi:hypothetical protein
VPAAKSANTVTLMLLDAASRTYSDTERVQLRADVLGQLGLTEQEASQQLTDAREAAENADAPEAADDDAPAAKSAGAKG